MLDKPIYILAIESSCDDTAAAVLKNDCVLSNVVATQHVHKEYGGVVPELASRAHQQNIVPVIHEALKKAQISKTDLNAIAFTRGPGLMGSLLVGTSFAKSLSLGLSIPLIEVNHMQAHILAHFIAEEGYDKPTFPFLAMTLSGGHTQLILVRDYFDMEVIGETLDDAIGEAYDKCGKMMGLPYPAGPHLDKLAQQGNPNRFDFPIPNVKNLDFSFSGLKTAVRYFIQKEEKLEPHFVQNNLEDICASFQKTVITIVMNKLKKAVKQTGVKQIAIGGGVSANSGIRATLKQAEKTLGWKTYIPKFEYTTDNAAMIGITAYLKYTTNEFTTMEVSSSSRYTI